MSHSKSTDAYEIFRKSREYGTWRNMIRRCYSTYMTNYHCYGGRGITVCERWRKSVHNFITDMGKVPDGMSLDRIDNNGNYEPSNCRWATRYEQSINTRQNKFIEHSGTTLCIKDWSRKLGIDYSTFRSRMKKWDKNKAFDTPLIRNDITFNGVTATLAEWSRITGLSESCIRYRQRKAWGIDEMLTIKSGGVR